ncbi:MAG: hypothetical protein LC730_06425, partial [Acidobacteria bacterium]|nr:hypothetical protein [Acidobacteriota bacterium]
MMNQTRVATIAVFLAAFLFAAAAVPESASAQTRRKRTAVPVVSPTPASGDPEIISRADDLPADGVITVPVPAPTQVIQPAASDSATIERLQERIKLLEGNRRKDPDEKQKRLSLNLDILTRAEQRAETLRKQLFEMIDKENSVKSRLNDIENDVRPETIERNVALVGSLRP